MNPYLKGSEQQTLHLQQMIIITPHITIKLLHINVNIYCVLIITKYLSKRLSHFRKTL